MRGDVGAFYGVVFFFMILGTMIITKRYEMQRDKNEKARRFWEEAMQPAESERQRQKALARKQRKG